MIEVAFTLTSDDVVRAYHVHAAAQLKNLKAIAASLVTVLCIAGLLLIAIPNNLMAIGFIVTASMLGGAAYPLIMLRWYMPRVARRIYAQQHDLHGEMTVSADAATILLRTAAGEGRIPWSHFLRFREDQHMILLYRSDLLFQFIPKRVLTEAQVDAVRSLYGKRPKPPSAAPGTAPTTPQHSARPRPSR